MRVLAGVQKSGSRASSALAQMQADTASVSIIVRGRVKTPERHRAWGERVEITAAQWVFGLVSVELPFVAARPRLRVPCYARFCPPTG